MVVSFVISGTIMILLSVLDILNVISFFNTNSDMYACLIGGVMFCFIAYGLYKYLSHVQHSICITNTGCNRQINQDNYLYNNQTRVSDGTISLESHNPFQEVFAVFDGIGGLQSGEVASQLAAEALKNMELPVIHRWNYKSVFQGICNTLNEEVYQSNPNCEMGTTLVLAVCRKRKVYVCNVGDSSGYLIKRGKLKKITIDQTDQDLFNGKNLTVRKPTLLQYLGMNPIGNKVVPYCTVRKFSRGDMLLLCTGGLINMVEEQQVQNILNEKLPLEDRANQLLQKALEAGGLDNITFIINQK